MNLILEISNEQDAELILSLVKRLNVPFKKNGKQSVRQPKKGRKAKPKTDTVVRADPNWKDIERETLLAQVAKPVQETLDVETLKQAQNWHGPDREGLMQLLDEMDIQEPIEQFLAQITR